MKSRYLRTSDIAQAAGVHPNTVRLYEEWGFLPPIPRSASGYRRFTEAHLDQMRLARAALHGPWPGRNIKRSALDMVRQAASGDLGGALEQAYHHLALVQAERAHAEAAAGLLDRWAQGAAADATAASLRIGQAARLLGVTTDVLRNWERNGLIQVPRDPHNGYRMYGAVEIGRLRVIRMLSRAGYSLMAILRMLLQLDRGQKEDLRQVLDTPRPDEDVYSAADRWLSTLVAFEQRARELIAQLEEMVRKRQR
jgi:DNA-binding transcriptional MerR regulator